MKTLFESILSTANVGKNALSERIKEFFKKNNTTCYIINNDLTVTIKTDPMPYRISKFYRDEFPDWLKVKYIDYLWIDCDCDENNDYIKNLPQNIEKLTIENLTTQDFSFLKGINVKNLIIFNSQIRSLKGLPKTLNKIFIGQNEQHFSKKEIQRATGLKFEDIENFGFASFNENSGVNGVVKRFNDYSLNTEYKLLDTIMNKFLKLFKTEISKCGKYKFDFLDKSYNEEKFDAVVNFYLNGDEYFLSLDFDLYSYRVGCSVTKNEKWSDKNKYQRFSGIIDEFTPENLMFIVKPVLKYKFDE